MAFFCDSLCCENSFRDFNKYFINGVPPEIASAVNVSRLAKKEPEQLYAADMTQFDAAAINHFERDWLGIGGDSWFGPEAGELVYRAFVDAIQAAGKRQIKAVWVESDAVSVQTIEDDRLVLLLVGSQRPQGDAHSGGTCGKVEQAAS